MTVVRSPPVNDAIDVQPATFEMNATVLPSGDHDGWATLVVGTVPVGVRAMTLLSVYAKLALASVANTRVSSGDIDEKYQRKPARVDTGMSDIVGSAAVRSKMYD